MIYYNSTYTNKFLDENYKSYFILINANSYTLKLILPSTLYLI